MIRVYWPRLVLNHEPIIMWMNLGNASFFRLIAYHTTHPKTALFIGLERVGCFLFPKNERLSPDYVSEKLHLSLADSAIMCDFIHAQGNIEYPQVGEYEARYIMSNEIYHVGNEQSQLPLVPIILPEDKITLCENSGVKFNEAGKLTDII